MVPRKILLDQRLCIEGDFPDLGRSHAWNVVGRKLPGDGLLFCTVAMNFYVREAQPRSFVSGSPLAAGVPSQVCHC